MCEARGEDSVQLTLQADYALRVLIHTAVQADELSTIAEITASFGISRGDLMKVVHRTWLRSNEVEGMTPRRVSLYWREDCIFASSMSRTTEGVWVSNELVLKINGNATDSDIGAAVKECLEQSRIGIPHPTDWEEVDRTFLEKADVKSWDEFEQGASHVDIKSEQGKLSISPDRKAALGGFEANPLAAVIQMSTEPWSDISVGGAIRKAIIDSRTK